MSIALILALLLLIGLVIVAWILLHHPQKIVDSKQADALVKALKQPVVSKDQMDAFLHDSSLSLEQGLLAIALSYAKNRVPSAAVGVSKYRVGAVVRGASGAVYIGCNTEFIGEPLSTCVHAEQSAVQNAFLHGEKGLSHLAVNAAPCGMCRQFLNELDNADALQILMVDDGHRLKNTSLRELLPFSFGPANLGRVGGMLNTAPFALNKGIMSATMYNAYSQRKQAMPIVDPAILANLHAHLQQSYAPYSQCPSAACIVMKDGSALFSVYLENAAFNPSLGAMPALLNQWILSGMDPDLVQYAILASIDGSVVPQIFQNADMWVANYIVPMTK